jgi:serpin B
MKSQASAGTPNASPGAMRAYYVLFVAAGLAAACSHAVAPQQQSYPAEAVSALARNTSPSVPAADQQSLRADNVACAMDLYGAIRAATTGNVFFSPYSISNAFAMTYAGARGQTATEMAKALHFSLPPDELHPAFDWLDLQLASRATAEEGASGTPFTLNVTNGMWGERTEQWEQQFLDTLAVDYGAGVRLVDFMGDPSGAEAHINAWVSTQTDGHIPNLLPPNAISTNTRFAIIDAVDFQASWAQPFFKASTAPASFTKADGTAVQVPTMFQVTSFPYAEGTDWQAVELAYQGGQVAMDIVLPAAGGDAALDALLASQSLGVITGALASQPVELHLPQFQVTGGAFTLDAILEGLGMVTAWTAAADFTGMVSGDTLYLTQAYHQAYLKVDEDGTEAAAATAVLGADAGVALPPPVTYTVNVDHPFLVAIRDLPTGTILFLGKIGDPNG